MIVRNEIVELSLGKESDLEALRDKLRKDLTKVDADIKRVDGKLCNPDFVNRAPEEIIEGEREKREEAVARRAKIVEALERMAQAT